MEALLNTIISAFGWSIFHSLWQGAVIYALLFLFLQSRSATSSKIKHNLAFGAICLMFVSFLLTFVSIIKIPASALNINLPQQLPLNFDAGIMSTPMTLSSIAERYFPYLVGLYALGLIIQCFLIIHGYRKLNDIKNSNHIPVPELWSLRFTHILGSLNINKQVGFYLSDKVNVPLVIGFFKPVILFPVCLATQLEITQVEAILIHELSHIRRNDFLLNLIKTGIETMLFFNPFVWLSSRFICIEREHDCDDLVVRTTGTPLTYAHALLKIELIKEKDTPTLSLAASGSSQHLYQRIKRITDMKTTYMNAKQRIFAVTLTLATIISIAWVSPAKEKATIAVETVMSRIKKFPMENLQQQPARLLEAHRVILPIDSPEKKKKVKIITVDEHGNKKEYSSVSDLPDSLKKGADGNNQPIVVEVPIIDSASIKAMMQSALAISKGFNTPEEKIKWEKLGLKMQKEGEAFGKRFNSPAEIAKWEKLGLKMQKEGEAFAKKFNSPEEQAKWKEVTEGLQKYAEELNFKINTSMNAGELQKLNEKLKLQSKELEMKLPNTGNPDQINMKLSYKYDLESPETAAVKNTAEYKKLKKEFEEKVEKLKKKQEKKK
jgi:bla regulator protein BlaR1